MNNNVLHLKGDPHEIGFQHGSLLASEISELVPKGLDAATAVIAKTICISYEEAWKLLKEGREAATGYFPDEILEEMKGISEGVSSKGYKMSFDEIILWNTM